MKTETEKLREWMRDQEQSALALLHQALVKIALDEAVPTVPRMYPQKIARTALRQLALDHPEVVENLLAREAKRRTA